MQIAAMYFALLAVTLHLTVGGPLLTWLGDPYTLDGGGFVWKIHPGSYSAYMAGFVTLLAISGNRGAAWLGFWQCRHIALSITSLLVCVILEITFTGIGNPIVLLDTFLPSCMLALALAHATERYSRYLYQWLLTMLAANSVIALFESLLQVHMIPQSSEMKVDYDLDSDFRAVALSDHPLTGATASVVGLVMAGCIRNPVGRVLYQLLMLGAIMAFGGRAALISAIGILLLPKIMGMIKSILHRDSSAVPMFIGSADFAMIFAAGLGLAMAAGLGTRLQGHFYWDASAQVRLAQWHILGLLSATEILFGATRTDLLRHVHMLDLSFGVPIIENFWLLLFTSTGLLGFPIFLTGLGALLVWCCRHAGPQGALLVIAVSLITSTSNSLGRKSPLLLIMVAAIVAIHGRKAASTRDIEAGKPCKIR